LQQVSVTFVTILLFELCYNGKNVKRNYFTLMLTGSKKIFLHKLNEVSKDTKNTEVKTDIWQLKVIGFRVETFALFSLYSSQILL